LRDQDSSFVTTQIIPGAENMCVKDLIHLDGKQWKRGIIEEFFNERDVSSILSIPLFDDVEEYLHTWMFNSKGEYSVKSAYYILHYGEFD
jgi:hypothetical protein